MRSTLTCPIIITFSLAASLAACSLVEEVPERTTLEMPTDGAELLSADGLFGVRFDPAQFTTASPVSIQTIRDLSVDGVVSLTYEVQSAVALPTALEVFHLSAQFDDPSSMALATVDGDRAAALASTWDVAQGWLVSTDVGVTQRRFAVVELGIRDNQCLASACGTVCTYCDPLVASCQDDLGECNRTGACVPAGATRAMTTSTAGTTRRRMAWPSSSTPSPSRRRIAASTSMASVPPPAASTTRSRRWVPCSTTCSVSRSWAASCC
ncbi:MAG: hypothetical protein H6730_34280 [Deltaproteobacteria bacterium]|nr:hypothetical protein [Deltaproteobacteria bacterium]